MPASTPAVSAFDIGSRRQLFVDDLMVAHLDGARFKLGEPIPREVAIRTELPWEGNSLWVVGMFELDGTYYMYYRGHADAANAAGADESQQTVALARSSDGVHWEKPKLGAVDWHGSKDNNLIQGPDGGLFHLDRATFFLDPRPGVPAGERIKVLEVPNIDVAWKKNAILQPELWVSADGVRFRRSGQPVYLTSKEVNAFDGTLVFWSPAENKFIGYFRWSEEVPVGKLSPSLSRAPDVVSPDLKPEYPDPRDEKRLLRSACLSTSPDLIHWSPLHPMSYGDTPREHIYETGTFAYYRAPDQYICLANRLFIGRRALEDSEIASLKIIPTRNGSRTYTYDNDINDLILLSTRPGSSTFHRQFMEAFVRPGRNPGNWTSRDNYSGSWVYQTGPDEMSFLVTRQHRQPGNHIQRFSLRLDGFASINAPYAGGEMVTTPIIFAGDHLELNYATSAAGQIQIEIQDAAGQPLPGYTLADSAVLIGDRIAGAARWHGGAGLAKLAGRPVRLRFVMRDADLYSYRFAPAN